METLEGREVPAAPVVQFSVVNDWGSGFQGNVVIRNDSAQAIDDWRLSFNFNQPLSQIWNADVQSQTGGVYTVSNVGWNKTIAPGASVAFGFVSSPGNVTGGPSNFLVNGPAIPPPPAPLPTLTISDAVVTEGNAGTTNATLTVRLSAAAAGAVTVGYATADGSAKAGDDYAAAAGALTFAPGETSKTITVAVRGDALFEADEAFFVRLTNPTAAVLGDAEGVVAVRNDDPAPEPPPATGGVDVRLDVKNSWTGGYEGSIVLTNRGATAVDGWTVSFDLNSGILSSWNATPANNVGNRYTFSDLGWNKTIAAGGSVTFGFTAGASVGGPAAISNIVFNGRTTTPPTTTPPTVTITDASAAEPTAPAPVAVGPMTYLSTVGNQIVDAQGNTVKLAGVNWFGFETGNLSPHGLHVRNWRSMMDQMKSLGYNTIRLPFANQMFDAGSQAQGINYNLNADLQGLSPLRIMDKIVDYAGEVGLRIMLDNHRSNAGGGPNDNGLWYTAAYPESRWIADWTMLATRYAGKPQVVAADLMNEPHNGTWGTGNLATDWRLAAERAGNAILAVNPNLLIVVEGIAAYENNFYWWGGNLRGAKDHPVRLNVADRLVYSPHDYPQSVFNQPWFNDPAYPNNLPAVWDANWGYLYRQNIAPILLGEFGTKLETTKDQQWFSAITRYLGGDFNLDGANDLAAGKQGPSWTYWSWNPNSGDTGGILADDWTTVQTAKHAGVVPIQFQFPATGGGGTVTPAPNQRPMTFTVRLSAPSTQTVRVDYATANGTATANGAATAGLDYLATNGTLTFAPGEVEKTIVVMILSDREAESAERFRVLLSNAMNATLADAAADGEILNTTPTV
ncbi:MAG: cellulase family glycosylhydrolase [Planctomycetia bacterium]